MSFIDIEPVGRVEGEIDAPPSKSYTHRAYFVGYISGNVKVINPLKCDDTTATLNSLKVLGSDADWNGLREVRMTPGFVNSQESGTTARFSVGIASLIHGVSVIDGHEHLRRRPMAPLFHALREMGVEIATLSQENLPVRIRGGQIKNEIITVDGSISSQFVSSLLLVAASKETAVRYTNLVSQGYVDMTVDTINKLGGCARHEGNSIYVERAPEGGIFRVPGDFSAASYFLAAGALFGKVRVKNLDMNDFQPDRKIVSILRDMGARVYVGENYVEVEHEELDGIEVNCIEHPDLFPVLSVLATYSRGVTVLRARHLRYKESDRIRSMALELKKMGAEVREIEDGLVIRGGHGNKLHGNLLRSHGDHRILMALSIAAMGAHGKSRLMDAECVSKSYPEFFQDLRRVVHAR